MDTLIHLDMVLQVSFAAISPQWLGVMQTCIQKIIPASKNEFHI